MLPSLGQRAGSASRRPMVARRARVALNLTLLVLLILSFATGWLASLLGLTEFGLHKYSSIALTVVAAGHVFLRCRSIAGPVYRRRSG